MPNARQLIYNLLVGTPWSGIGTGIQITADDNATVISPSIAVPLIGGTGSTNISQMDANTVIVQKEPYAQELAGPSPKVIVGPVRPMLAKNLIIGANPFMEIHRKVEVRILTRDIDMNDQGFTLDGDNTRSKLLDNIRAIVELNHKNPDGLGTYDHILVQDPGQDSDTVTSPEPINLYRTAMQIEVVWFEEA